MKPSQSYYPTITPHSIVFQMLSAIYYYTSSQHHNALYKSIEVYKCINCFITWWYYNYDSELLPFLAAWSWQFSYVQGPQALHEDSSHSTGQLIWQSWVVFGGMPWQRLLSTGRNTMERKMALIIHCSNCNMMKLMLFMAGSQWLLIVTLKANTN